MKIISGEIEQFQQYSPFSNLEEFNSHMEKWCEKHRRDFTKGQLIGFMWLARFAAKVPGVANAKIGTILKTIHEEYNGNGISRSTFKRMIGKAKKLGILTVYETSRNDGSQSSNLYVFNRFPTDELPSDEKLNQPKKTKYLLKTIKNLLNKRNKQRSDIKAVEKNNGESEITPKEIKAIENSEDKICQTQCSQIQENEIDDRPSYWKLLDPNGEIKPKRTESKQEMTQQTDHLDYSNTCDQVPAPFAKWVKIFFNNSKIIEEYWRMVLIAAYKNNMETKHEQVLTIAIDAFKQLIRKIKTTKEVKKPIAYFYGIVSKKLKELYFEELYEMGFPVEIPKQNLRPDLSLYKELMCNPVGNSLYFEQQIWNKETLLPFENRTKTELERNHQAANRGKYFFAIFKELLES